MPFLEELIGQRLAIGIPGRKITPAIVRHFKELRAGGLILYRINFESPAQLKKLISDLENALERKLLVMADHEGGRVIMFRDGVTVFPDNLALGKTGKIEYAKKQGEIESKELRRLGMDVNLAPVLDVLTSAYSPNIGIRSYGEDWRLVSAMGAARISAMQKGGISACAKHFPGKGHAPVDAHLGLPVIGSSWKEMRAVHLKPFIKAIEIGVDCVMSSHPYYPKLDPEPNRIVTFSKKIIWDLLRGELGFKGVISSDDLEMGAIKAICPVGEAAVRATAAGHDLLLICHDMESQKKVFHALLNAYKNKELSIADLEKSAERIEKLRSKREKRFQGGPPHPELEGKRVAEKISCGSATLLKRGRRLIPLRPDMLHAKRVAVIFPKFSSLDKKIMIEKAVSREKEFIAQEFERFDLKAKIKIVSIEPSDTEIEEAAILANQSDLAILFCFDAHLYPSNKKLLESVQRSSQEAVIVLLRDPYDVEYVQERNACVTDFGWRLCQIRAAIQKMFSA